MIPRFQYDYLAVATAELKKAIRWRGIAQEIPRCAPGQCIHQARSIMRHHAIRSRRAFNGELLAAN